MTKEPYREPLNWENVRKDSTDAYRTQKIIENAPSTTERYQAEGSGFWWDAQKYVDQVVPAEFVNPDKFDLVNYRYQVYARAPPIQCPSSCLGEVSEEKPPVRYNVKRIAVDKSYISRQSKCNGHWSEPVKSAIMHACNGDQLDISGNNNAAVRQRGLNKERHDFLKIKAPHDEIHDGDLAVPRDYFQRVQSCEMDPRKTKNVSLRITLPPVASAIRVKSVDKGPFENKGEKLDRDAQNNLNTMSLMTSFSKQTKPEIHESAILQDISAATEISPNHLNTKKSLGVFGRRRLVLAPLATKDNISCLLFDDLNGNNSRLFTVALEKQKLDVFSDVFIVRKWPTNPRDVALTDKIHEKWCDKDNLGELSSGAKSVLLTNQKLKTVDLLSRNNNAKVSDKMNNENRFHLRCDPEYGHDKTDPCKPSKRLLCHPAKPYTNFPKDKCMPCTRHFSDREMKHRNQSRDKPVSLGNVRCSVLHTSEKEMDKNLIVCEPDPDRKTPEIGYDTYKIVGSRVFRPHPPPDYTKFIKLKPHLEEYREFTRRCPNFSVGRYDRSDPLNEMLLPSNKSAVCLKGSLTPFVYTRNTKARNLPPLFHKNDRSVGGLNWQLPSFL